MNPKIIQRIAAIILILLSHALFARQSTETITRADKEALVKALCERIEKIYVFTENTKKVCDLLKGNLRRGAYEGIATPREFAGRLNDDIGGLTHVSIGISFSAEPVGDAFSHRLSHLATVRKHKSGLGTCQ